MGASGKQRRLCSHASSPSTRSLELLPSAMATAVPPPIALPAAQPTEILVASDEDSNSESENGAAASAPDDAPAKPPATRPAYVYTRRQLIYLYKSPLVIDPPDMPAMKYWFGCVHRKPCVTRTL
jgi:hypothetical protein